MKIIGLCGGSGSGKGTVADVFTTYGMPVIDTDDVYHKLTSSDSACLRELRACFGDQILTSSGALDRSVLARIVFADGATDKRELLNEIAHKHVLEHSREMLSEFSASGYEMAVVDAPLLYESGFHKECDVVVAVIADKSIRVDRIVSRDSITVEQAERRINAQIPDSVLIDRADFVIENNGTTEELEQKVCDLIFKLRNN